jgi:hypothetical protein
MDFLALGCVQDVAWRSIRSRAGGSRAGGDLTLESSSCCRGIGGLARIRASFTVHKEVVLPFENVTASTWMLARRPRFLDPFAVSVVHVMLRGNR